MKLDQIQAPQVTLHIGHEQLNEGSGGKFDHFNPVSGEMQASIPLAGETEINSAVAKAVAAFPDWLSITPETRRDLLLKLAQLIHDNLNPDALLECFAADQLAVIQELCLRLAAGERWKGTLLMKVDDQCFGPFMHVAQGWYSTHTRLRNEPAYLCSTRAMPGRCTGPTGLYSTCRQGGAVVRG